MSRIALIAVAAFISSMVFGQMPPWEERQNPKPAPTPNITELEKLCTEELDAIERVKKEKPTGKNKYYLDGKLFTGWACSDDYDEEHQYRYSRFENGLLMRQIGYYSNGTLDHDFHMKEDKPFASQLMWRSDGNPYLEHYYSAPGVKDGYQRRWHANNKLAHEAKYEDGILIYENDFDENGQIVGLKGTIITNTPPIKE